MLTPHLHMVRVYYEDTDFSGFVYHASHLKFLERGRTEFLRGLGVVHSDLHREGVAFVVARMVLDYRKPAVMDDWLTIKTLITEARGASLLMAQQVLRGDTCLVQAEVTVATVSQGKAVRLPAALRRALPSAPP